MKISNKLRAVLAGGVVGTMLLSSLGMAASAAPASLPDGDLTGSIEIHKLEQPKEATNLPNNGLAVDSGSNLPDPIEDVDFTIYPMIGVDLTTNEGWANAETVANAFTPLGADAKRGVTTGTGLGGFIVGADNGPKTTNASGVATFSTLPLGMYLVKETSTPNHVTASLPFLITVPMTNATDTTQWNYNPVVYPKNVVSKVSKNVVDKEAHGFGDLVTWDINTNFPVASRDVQFNKWGITDRLDDRLDIKNVKVTINAGETNETVFTIEREGTTPVLERGSLLDVADVEMKATPRGATTGTGVGDFAGFRLTPSGLVKLNADDSGLLADLPVKMEIETTVNAVGEIPNSADLWVNNPGLDSDWDAGVNPPVDPPVTPPVTPPNTPEEPNPVTKWGGLKVLKFTTDSDGEERNLEGAEFVVFATNKAGGTFEDATPVVLKNFDGTNKTSPVVKSWKNNDTPVTNFDASTWVSGTDGKIRIEGLRYSGWADNAEVASGDAGFAQYWLVEVKSPAGFELLAEPVAFTVGADWTTIDPIGVKNVAHNAGAELPLTGAGGIALLLLVGGAVAGGSAYGINRVRKSGTSA